MTGILKEKTGNAKIGVVDNWHPHWAQVRSSFEKVGATRSLLQPDGWLSARENLLVAFVDSDIAGHVCFRVEPRPHEPGELGCVSAEVDSFAVDPAYASLGIAASLKIAAEARARELNCGELRGFDHFEN